jgi:hypothetical protein
MRPRNPFYNQCVYLRYIYPKTANINAYSVVAWCEKFMINIYKLKTKTVQKKEMACINNSPYLCKSTCNGFKSKSRTQQTTLFNRS